MHACFTVQWEFLLVQNFAESLTTALEENLFFTPPHGDHIPTWIDQLFRSSYFCGAQPIHEKREILHHAKISL